jgi:hypothetical protein
MEVQIDDAAAVAAHRTAPAGLLDEDPLYLLQPPRHGLASAALAAPAVSALSLAAAVEGHEPVMSATPQLAGAIKRRRTTALLEERDRRFGCHERMFVHASDEQTAIMRAGPLAQWQSAGLQ